MSPDRETARAGPLRRGLALVMLGLLLLGPTRAGGQEVEHPLEALDTSSPRATMESFLDTTEEMGRIFKEFKETGYKGAQLDSFRAISRAIGCFDLSEVPPSARREVGKDGVVLLWDILARIELPPLEEVPGASEMNEKIDRGEPARWAIPHTEITLARIEEGPRKGEYLVSAGTIARLEEFSSKARVLPYREEMPVDDVVKSFKLWGGTWFPPRVLEAMPPLLKRELFGQATWKWIAVVLMLGTLFLSAWLARRLMHSSSDFIPLRDLLRRVAAPLTLLLLTPVVSVLLRTQVNISGGAIPIVRFLVPTILYLSWAWLAWLVSLMVAEAVIASPRIREGGLNAHLLRLMARVFGLVVVVLILFYGGTQLGLPLYGLVAGVGVGGLAIALAAQNTVENFIGSINLFTDRPIRVGDFCLYGENVGTVEEIGVRSTKIRGIDRTVTTVPNADFSRMKITNFTRRDRMLIKTTLNLRYETTPDQLRHCLANLRKLLLEHPRISDDPARVRLVGFGASSYDLEIFAYALTADYNEFLAIQEDLFLRIIDVIEESGTGFAFPSQTLYLGRDSGLDADRQQKAEGQVRQWRSSRELPFPNFSPEFIEEVRDRLDYPPAGSAVSISDGSPWGHSTRTQERLVPSSIPGEIESIEDSTAVDNEGLSEGEGEPSRA